MSMRTWIRNLFARPTTRAIRKTPLRFRPVLETLEDRCVPSTFTVINTLDDGSVGTLRWAVGQANSHVGNDTIRFSSTVFNTPQTINLTGGQLELTDTTGTQTITGPNAGVTVNAGTLSRVLQVDALVTASISKLTITGGNSSGNGGGIYNNGTLTLNNDTISNNSAPSGGGGGVFNSGTLTLNYSTVANNSAPLDYLGLGGGVSNSGTLTLTNDRITNNSAGSGGGVFNSGTLTLSNSTVANNSANVGGGVSNSGTATLANSTISANIANAAGGGVVDEQGTTTLTNCTISANSVLNAGTGSGGGVFNVYGTDTLTNCTVSGNSTSYGLGSGVMNYGTTTLTNTIVAGNSSSFYGPSAIVSYGTLSGSSNLIGTGGSGGLSNGVNGNIVGVANPGLAPLGNYGGTTQTMPLLPGSPAINAGTSGTGIPATDQRGKSRVGAVDIGAFESQGFHLTPVWGSFLQISHVGTPFAHPLAVHVTANNSVEPVNGGIVSYVANSFYGATAILLDHSAVIAGGQAAVTAAPNNAIGIYTVVASAAGSSSAWFVLINIGTTFTNLIVNTTSDSLFPGPGLLSLREAIAFRNTASSGNWPITFDSTVFNTAQTITLTGGPLELSSTIGTESITGPAAGVTISGGGTSRVFQVDALVTASISGLTITGGYSTGNGGGVNNSGSLTLTNCTVSNNSASSKGAGVWNAGTATLSNTTLSGNSASYSGGGVYNSGGTATLTNCTISANSGGGVSNFGTATLTNCTISANSGGYSGGGVLSYGRATLSNTIVAGNSAYYGGDIAGSVSGSNNLIGTGGSGGLSNGVNGNIVGVANPLLAPLGNYGGTTQTMPLLPGSLAINAGTSGAGIPATDQRGMSRVGAVDIGAFESQGFTFTAVPSSTPQTSNIGTAFAHPLAVSVTANNPIEPVDGGIVGFLANNVGGATAMLLATSAVIAGGTAGVTAAPNNAVGSYTVVASAGSLSASFALTNNGPIFTNLIVNTTSDSLLPGTGLLSLREAIAFNNFASSGNSPITFDSTVFNAPQTITLTGGQLELSNTIGTESITGPAAGVTISGGGASRVFQVDALVAASISGLTITGGSAGSGNGGGVNNAGTLTLNNDTITNNSAGSGAGVFNSGTLTLSNSAVANNSANYKGGGVYNSYGATATLTNCTISANSGGNTGGGVWNNGTATLSNCTIGDNSANYGGGGVGNFGTTTLSDCAISGNSAPSGSGGGVLSYGTATLSNCTLSANSAQVGGGMLNHYGNTATLTNCTISGNTASGGGGGVLSNGTTTLSNCTISANSTVYGNGGGVDVANGTATLNNCTISGNSANWGGGVFIVDTATLTGCTISGNSAVNGGGVWDGGTATLTNCIISDNSASVGGGLYMYIYGGTATLTYCTVSGNTASVGGGGLFNSNGVLNVGTSDFSGVENAPDDIEGGYNDLGGNTF